MTKIVKKYNEKKNISLKYYFDNKIILYNLIFLKKKL